MRRFFVKNTLFLSLLLVLLLSIPSFSDFSVGYETLTILPHAFTGYYWDKDSGLGFKASADFGASALSFTTTIASVIGSLGFAGYKDVSFVTFSGTKDLSYDKEKNSRTYLKLGAFVISGKDPQNNLKSFLVPVLGMGWEWQKVFGDNWATSSEISYPEFLTLGIRYYF